MNRFGYEYEQAKNVVAISPLVSMCCGPLFAAGLSRLGKKPLFLIIDFILSIGVLMYMRTLDAIPSIAVIGCIAAMGVHYSLFVAIIWPAMTLTIPQSCTAPALGLATTIQNLFIAALAYYFGAVNQPRTRQAYDESLLSDAVVAFVSLLLSIWMLVEDLRTGKILSLPENDKRVGEMRKKM